MLILTKKDIEQCFTMEDAIAASKKALAIYTSDQAQVPLRANLNVSLYNGQSLYMPAATSGELVSLGVKIVSVYPDNIQKNLPSVPASMVVVDAKTGIVSAILEGTYLTQLRTGAVQGAATDLLASKDASIAAMIGTGGQGLQQCLAMLTVRNLKELRVFDIDFERAKAFAKQLSDLYGNQFDTQFIAVETSQQAVDNADIITTATTSKRPTFDASYVKNGAHINGVGAYTKEMIELPSEIFENTKAVFFDTKDGVLAEAGDVLSAIEKGILKQENISGELGELVLNPNLVDLSNATGVTVFKTVGSAVLDVVTAQLIVEKAKEKGIGQEISL